MVQPIDSPRALGVLLGAAVGDALGAPLEGLSAQQVHHHYGVVTHYVDGMLAWKKKPYRWRLPGLYSDDTQQALVLAEVLLAGGTVDPVRVAALYQELADPPGSFMGAHRGIGRSFRQVLKLLHEGTAPLEAGQISAGPGAAMRIAPVALYHATRPRTAMAEDILAASLMTHRDCRSLTGAFAVALLIHRLLNGEERKASLVFSLADDVYRAESALLAARPRRVVGLETYPHSLSAAIAHVEKVLDLPAREPALAALVQHANHHGPSEFCRRPTMGFAPALIPTCLYLFLTTDSFAEAVTEAVNLGGDADTAGAIVGAIAGAHYGRDQIPARWLAGLRNRPGIALRAQALAGHKVPDADIPDLVQTERELSAAESRCRDELLGARQGGGDLGANRRL